MVVNAKNLGGNGNVEFALQQLVDGGFWASVSTVSVDVTADSAVTAALPVVANAVAGEEKGCEGCVGGKSRGQRHRPTITDGVFTNVEGF